ncbi:MAG: enoyl-CoA hydratase [Gemmatimonadetes bacterium]|nr:enoyl-CoA hydratase [Gemmatimonadota bacterium]
MSEAARAPGAGAVHFRRDGATATITFDRPDARNALTWSMFDELDQAIDRIHGESGLRVAVLRGADGHFVSGTDITQFTAFRSAADGEAYERRLEVLIARLEAVPVATIAAVEGAAAGAGLMIAAVCDLRVCTPDARFGAPIARTVGNCLSVANTARLIAHFGPGRLISLLFRADLLGAEDARLAGFVGEVVRHSDFNEHVATLCARLAAQAPITLRVTKEAVRRVIAAGMGDGGDLIRLAYGSRDFREGVAAFLEKREPRWEGT